MVITHSFSNYPFQVIAAKMPPTNGATTNNHNCDNALPPAKTAGPKLRAGFTEVPVIGMATR